MLGNDPGQPYWKVHHGIARPWTPTAEGRRGCMVLLLGGFLVVALTPLVVALVLFVT